MRVKASTVENLPLLVPHPDEQRRVVAEIEKQLSRLEEAVATLNRVKAGLSRYKTTVLNAAVEGHLGESRSGDRSNGLPVGWRRVSIGEIASVGTGATPARSKAAFYAGGTIAWVTSAAVNKPFVDSADQSVTARALEETNLTLYPPGTLLLAMYGEGKTRGRCSELRIAATTNQALAALQTDETNRPWLKLFLEHNYEKTRQIASGGVQPNLNLGLIRGIRLPLPPLDERQRIVADVDRRLSIVREIDEQARISLGRAEVLRQQILASAFVQSVKSARDGI
jgi:type I restriction enzyme S subunit